MDNLEYKQRIPKLQQAHRCDLLLAHLLVDRAGRLRPTQQTVSRVSIMRATLVVAAAWFACLRFVCLAQSPGGSASISLSTCSSAAAAATAATGTAVVDVEGAGAGCDETTEPFTGIPGTARERSFFVSGGSIAEDRE